MSLLTLLLSLLTSLLPVADQLRGEAESAAPPELPERELVLELLPDAAPMNGREEELMHAAIIQRCEDVGLRGLHLRQEGKLFRLHVRNGLIPTMEEYTDTLDDLEYTLNARTTLRLLRVHPDSEQLVQDAALQQALVEYEKAMVAYEDGHDANTPRPSLPPLPARLNGYMLAEWRKMNGEDSACVFEYLVVQHPEFARGEGILITEEMVRRCRPDSSRPHCVEVHLSHRGAHTMERLTSPMHMGKQRLAIIINGTVTCAPIIHTPLSDEFTISGLSREEIDQLAAGLALPLPRPVKVQRKATASGI